MSVFSLAVTREIDGVSVRLAVEVSPAALARACAGSTCLTAASCAGSEVWDRVRDRLFVEANGLLPPALQQMQLALAEAVVSMLREDLQS